MVAALQVPGIGVDLDFDEFVDSQLGDIGEFLDEERSLVCEALSDNCETGSEISERVRSWWNERYEGLREGFWEEWSGPWCDPSDALAESQVEIERLREQVGESNRRVANWRKRSRMWRRKYLAEQMTSHSLEIELAGWKEVADQAYCLGCNRRIME